MLPPFVCRGNDSPLTGNQQPSSATQNPTGRRRLGHVGAVSGGLWIFAEGDRKCETGEEKEAFLVREIAQVDPTLQVRQDLEQGSTVLLAPR